MNTVHMAREVLSMIQDGKSRIMFTLHPNNLHQLTYVRIYIDTLPCDKLFKTFLYEYMPTERRVFRYDK